MFEIVPLQNLFDRKHPWISGSAPHYGRHRRRIELEDKAKVVAFVWGAEFVPFLAALDERKGRIHPIFPNGRSLGNGSSRKKLSIVSKPSPDYITFITKKY